MVEEVSAWGLPATTLMAAPAPPAPTMVSAQVHPGGSFHIHQPGAGVAMGAVASSVATAHAQRGEA
eukprot:2490349-Alexandrium_andersonii.AAC.1